jgi:hypothetical protein
LTSRFPNLVYKGTSEQRPPINNGHNFGVVVVLMFDCIGTYIVLNKEVKELNI